MARPPVIIAAAVGGADGKCLTITFSHEEAARLYNDYLKKSDFYKTHECKATGNRVSIVLPAEITTQRDDDNDDDGVILVFEDQMEAMTWESTLKLLAGKDLGEKQRRFLTTLKAEDFYERLGLRITGGTTFAVGSVRSTGGTTFAVGSVRSTGGTTFAVGAVNTSGGHPVNTNWGGTFVGLIKNNKNHE
jgi:hypothetical protein